VTAVALIPLTLCLAASLVKRAVFWNGLEEGRGVCAGARTTATTHRTLARWVEAMCQWSLKPVNDLILARAVRVAAVVIWIGAVSMAITTVLPALRGAEVGDDRPRALGAIERRFVWQAPIAMLSVGAAGLYIAARLDRWTRFGTLHLWWMHATVTVWLISAMVLFVVEPLGLRRLPHRVRHGTRREPKSCHSGRRSVHENVPA
jgi:uncharacterized membrane protein